jgi:MOSC domain-containing protein YiiM
MRAGRIDVLTVDAVLAAPVAPLGPRGAPSGIVKRPVPGRVRVARTGLVGDAQGDPRNHGGPEKAVHHYPRDHYAVWRSELGDLPVLAERGAFGENLSTSGPTEADIAVGDTFRVGTAILQVSQGRQPCWKLNARFGISDMSRQVQGTGRTGWYYRVIEEGDIEAGDEMRLVERHAPEWTIERLWRVFYVDPLDRVELGTVARIKTLAEGWRAYAIKRIASGQVENWSRRLDGEE